MKVLLLGGNGFLGPHVVEELQSDYELRSTDIVPIDSAHETMQVDIADIDQVRRAAEGTDIIVNCSVLRPDRKLAFDVNTTGTYNTAESIELTQEAEEQGVDGLLLVVPYYNKPPQEGMYQHFKAIAGKTSLPCIVYNIMGLSLIHI